jgi:hypothetical protein
VGHWHIFPDGNNRSGSMDLGDCTARRSVRSSEKLGGVR